MMGFIPVKYLDGQLDPWEKQPVAAGKTLHVGTAMVFAAGALTVAAGANAPSYICMEEVQNTAANQPIHVIRVSRDTLYETQLAVASAAIAVGARYTLDATGEKITATDAGGVAEVASFEGAAAGDKVRVHF